MSEHVQPAHSFLQAAYKDLGYASGALLKATTFQEAEGSEQREWLEKGDWLTLAREVGAERIFFVENDPVVVFCSLNDAPSRRTIANTFRRVWCMARPQCLFLALPGELRIYSLNRAPVRNEEDWDKDVSPLEVVQRVADVATRLQAYRRERVESGLLFADGRFGNIDERADRRLIQDLKTVRQLLLDAHLDPKYAHALIGRSIFIRYLEDRQILTPKYFERVAKNQLQWQHLLAESPEKPDLSGDWDWRRYDRVLRDKDFAYAMFARLAQDFNGDMFPKDELEEGRVAPQHLEMLRRFLLGDVDPQQPSLFFWAYDFRVIPIELISSIYEEFYHTSVVDDKGTHYTPSTLVEYALSQVLTDPRLATKPKVLDPACGSGIFLVESYRRMVRYRLSQERHPRNSPQLREMLREILRTQIIGIEINQEAARVATFSLYLALLHYQEPPDILANPRLPHLLYVAGQKEDDDHYHVIFCSNAFRLTREEYAELEMRFAKSRAFRGRALIARMLQSPESLPIRLHDADVVVGNPPWFEVGKFLPNVQCKYTPEMEQLPSAFTYDLRQGALATTRELSIEHVEIAKRLLPAGYHSLLDTVKALSDDCFQADRWASAFDYPVGEKSYSQLFLYRVLTLVRKDGIVGLLVHSSTLFNQRRTSQVFRQRWLSLVKLHQVANFVHVRRLFFEQAVAPFVFVSYSHRDEQTDNYFVYLSMRHTQVTQQLRSVMLAKADRRIVRQSDVQNTDYLWKTYWWGTQVDTAVLAALDAGRRLIDFLPKNGPKPAYGFQYGSAKPSETLRSLRPLRSEHTKWYGPLEDNWFESPPSGVKRQPDERIYRGQRLIVIRGVKDNYGSFARLESRPFSFRHTIYCVPLPGVPRWQAKIIAGILWSSLGRYRVFMTSGSWGGWYDQTVPSDILSMPIRLPSEMTEPARRILNAVDKIRSWRPSAPALFEYDRGASDIPPAPTILEALDEAVFDLFGLSESERDVIRDFMTFGFDLFAKGPDSTSLESVPSAIRTRQGTIKDIPSARTLQSQLEGYLHAFLQVWNDELQPEGEFGWQLIYALGAPMLAIVFTTQEQGAERHTEPLEPQDWLRLLAVCGEALRQPISDRVYIDGIVRAVTDTQIVVIKRNEKWLWTRTTAREDAEATLLQASYLQKGSSI